MATEKRVRGAYIPRHDIAFNWSKALNFIPAKAEMIVYDADTTTYSGETELINGVKYPYISSDKIRFKFGDGVHNVNALPFATTENSGSSEEGSTSDTVNSVTVDNQDIVDATSSRTTIVHLNPDVSNFTVALPDAGTLKLKIIGASRTDANIEASVASLSSVTSVVGTNTVHNTNGFTTASLLDSTSLLKIASEGTSFICDIDIAISDNTAYVNAVSTVTL